MAKRFEQAKAYTEKYKGKLKPCRFCGNTDIRIASDRDSVIVESGRKRYRNVWAVVCSTDCCDCTRNYTSVRKAVDRWNEMQTQ